MMRTKNLEGPPRKESLTRKYAAEFMSGAVIKDENIQSRSGMRKAVKQKSDPLGLSNESREQRLRRAINFGNKFYSIAEAGKVSGIGEAFIRKWIGEGKLMLLGHPEGKRLYISGTELSELVIQYNLNHI